MRRKLSSGAESMIYLNDDNNIEKDRVVKGYRIKEIDDALRRSRTKKELRILKALAKMKFKVPRVIESTDTKIVMEYVDGVQLKKILDDSPSLAEPIGRNLQLMHESDIIHGDLTTSNMILKDEIYFIDFGLSFVSKRVEDKAVDIHLFKQALESRHYRVHDKAYDYFLKGYNPKNKKEILERLKAVESRGRYKERT